MQKIYITLFLHFLCLGAFSQSNPNLLNGCKTDQIHHSLYNSDPIYRQNYENAQTNVRNIVNSGVRIGGIYTIPVVVHVMHLGSAEGSNENISDAQIQSAIDNLNDAYANIGYNGLDIEIQFALAVRDPNCLPTDGINRINASALTSGGDAYATKGATNNNRTALKALSNWPNTEYYNIWIVTEIDNNNGGSGTQGYAYFPGAPNGTDGSIILFNAFGYDPTLSLGYNLKNYTNYNSTAIHELGHALDLFHTFEGDDVNDDGTPDTCPPTAAASGDECGDTDAHRRDDSDCQGGILATCNGVNNSTVYNNFMAYSSDICQNRFTANQKTRMRAAMEGPRASLLNSMALTTAPSQAPNTLANSCSPVTDALGLSDGYGGIMSVTYGNRTSTTSNAQNDGITYSTNGYLDFSQECSMYAEFEEGATVDISVTTWFNDHNIKVYVDWNNSGVFDAGEQVLNLNTVTTDVVSSSFVIPGTAVTGEYLRLRFNADIGTVGSACEAPLHGQVEDYAIYINPTGGGAPIAQFSANTTSVCSGNTLTFTDASTDATSYSWNFGTGASPTTATGVGPHVVTYTGSGTSTVTLDVTGPGGNDNETKTNYIIRNNAVTPAVSIASNDGDNSICSSTSVTFTATPTNGGTPSYQWKLNGGNVGSNSSTYINSTLADNNQISCVMTSTAACASPTTATSNTIIMDVISSVASSVSISASANPITVGDPVTFTATPVNGGTPSYQWKLNGGNVGTNSTTYNNSSLNNGDQVSCVMTSTVICASPINPTSNIITMTVNGGTCSTTLPGPGGVGTQNNTELWLDAEKITGVNNGAPLYKWQDVSGNLRHVSQASLARQPLFVSSGVNGKPIVDFDGTNDYMSSTSISDLNTDNISWSVVTSADNITSVGHIVSSGYTSGAGSTGSSHLWKTFTAGTYASCARTSTGTFSAINQGSAAGYQIISNVWNGSADQLTGFLNGNTVSTSNGVNASPAGHVRIRIGARSDMETQFFNGKIAEFFVFSKALNEAERIIVDNYLSAKYNITMAANDIYAYQSTHGNGAAGIGMSSSTSLTSARGSVVEMSNASSLANGDFIMWAHNNATTGPTTSGTPAAYGGTGEMMTRVWRADKTNDVGTVSVKFYLDGITNGGSTDFELLKDTDGNFSNATRITAGFSYDSNCDVATWTGVNFTDGDFFTIGNPDGAALLQEPITEFIVESNAFEEEEEEEEIANSENTLEIIDTRTESIQMKLYPNPTTGFLTIENILEGSNVEIYNSLGQLVYNSSILTGKNQYDFSYLNNGIYIVHLKDINNETISISQLMIQK